MRFKTIFTWPLIVKIFHTKAKITLCAITGSPILKRDRVFPHHALIAIYIFLNTLCTYTWYIFSHESWVPIPIQNLGTGSVQDLPAIWLVLSSGAVICACGETWDVSVGQTFDPSSWELLEWVVSTNLAPTWGPPVVCWFITFYEYYSYE